VPVHRGKLEFVLEVGHGAQPADDDGQAVVPREVHGQALVRCHLNAVYAPECRPGEFDALLEVEHRRLATRVRGDGDHDAIEHFDRSLHDIFMPQGYRVEGSRIHGFCGHPPS